jgi:hypothetical protein
MSDRLVTIATFETPLHANMAKAALEHAGIQSSVADEALGASWLFNNAIGFIKLQVMEQDAAVARKILEDTSPVEFPDPQEHEVFDPDEVDPPPSDDNPEPPLNSREENADRAFRGAILGLLLLPLHFYVFWLLAKVYFSNERLQPLYRQRALIAAAINAPIMLLMLMFLRSMLFY